MLRLFDVLANFPFTTSGMMSDYYYGQVAVADEKQNLRKLKYTSKLSKPNRMIAQGSLDNTRRKPNTNSTPPPQRAAPHENQSQPHTPPVSHCPRKPPFDPDLPQTPSNLFSLTL